MTPDRSYPSRNAASAGFISLNVLSFNGQGGGEKEKKKGGGKGPHTPCSLRLNTAAACNENTKYPTRKMCKTENKKTKKRTDGLSDVGSPFSHGGVAVHQRLLFLQVLDLVVVRQAVRAA